MKEHKKTEAGALTIRTRPSHTLPSGMKFTSNDCASQRLRIRQWFEKHNSLGTDQARHELGIMHPGGRVMELRKAGYKIITVIEWTLASNGRRHKLARYVYMGAPE